MKNKKINIKEAVVLLITLTMILSTVTVTAYTKVEQNQIELNTVHKGIANGAKDSIVWDNDMTYDGLGATQYDASINFDSYIADDFIFDETTDVGDVHWVGGYWGTDYQTGAFDWCISFMYDDGTGESPDSHPQNPTYAGPYCYDWYDLDFVEIEDTGSTIYYEISVDLPSSIYFPPDEKFWISIWAEGTYPPQSGWGYHDDPVALSQAVWGSDYFGYSFWTLGEVVQGFDFDMCFQLTEKGCEPSIDVEKYVWHPCKGEWFDADTEDEALDLPICIDTTFKIVIHNDGTCCGPLYNIQVYDIMHDSLKFISADPEPDEFVYDPPYYYMLWIFPGPLEPCETIEIYITAHVEGPECSVDFNYVEVYAQSDCEPYLVEDFDWAFVHAYEDDPPSPPVINGPDEGPAGENLCWTFHSTDPEGDPVQYVIDWGDGTTDTTGCYPSCTPVEVCHTYETRDTYVIKAIAKDCCWGAQSTESTFNIKIPRTRESSSKILLQLFERFPNAFPILRQLLGLS